MIGRTAEENTAQLTVNGGFLLMTLNYKFIRIQDNVRLY